MKLQAWIRLAVLIVVAASIAMTVSIDDGGATVKTAPSASAHSAGTVRGYRDADAPDGELRVELERLARPEPAGETEPQDAQGAGIFSVTSWYVPPPPPPPQPPPPPPKPTAPPLPFGYLGRYQESEALVIILVKGDRLYTVSPGEVIESTYRVEGVAGGRVELTYLPLNTKQTLDTGETS